jgi:hypothetical protein
MKKVLAVLLLSVSGFVNAQSELLNEDFSNGLPSTWTVYDLDGNTPGNSIFANAWVTYQTPFDTCVASTSYYVDDNGDEDSTGTSADYLVTPRVSLLTFGNMLQWDAKSGDGSYPDGYEVYVSTTDSLVANFTTQIKLVHSEKPYWKSYSINLADYGFVNQDVFVAFKNSTKNGYVLQIDNVRITGDDPANIENKENDIQIDIYPNPTTDLLNIKGDVVQSIEVYSISGQLMMSVNQVNQIDVSNLSRGAYYVKVLTSNGVVTKKIVKS